MASAQERYQPITCFAFLFLTCLLLSGAASAVPSIDLSKKSGPPTSRILVSGHGFEANVGVDIYFDTKDKALVITNGQGEFHDAVIFAPRSAYPGQHWVTALERNNDKGAQEPFLVQTDWPQFRFLPNHKGANQYENVLNQKTVGDLDLDWSYAMEAIGLASPSVVDGMVFIASGGSLDAHNASTGVLLWSLNTVGGAGAFCSPAVADGVVYFGDDQGLFYAVRAKDGILLWTYNAPPYIYGNPVVGNGVVYFGSFNSTLYALNARTGAFLWSYATGNEIYSSAAVSNGVVYVGSNDSSVYALNASTGGLLWRYKTNFSVYSSPAVSNGVVYVGSEDNNVYALNASTGGLLWKYQTKGPVYSSPAVSAGVVYLGSEDDNVYALDAATGAVLWSFKTGWHVDSSPAVANGVVYVGSGDSHVYALDANTGDLRWSYTTGTGNGGVNSSPAVVNGIVYIGAEDGNLYAFGLKHGQEKPEAASNRPGLNTLRPDFNLKASK